MHRAQVKDWLVIREKYGILREFPTELSYYRIENFRMKIIPRIFEVDRSGKRTVRSRRCLVHEAVHRPRGSNNLPRRGREERVVVIDIGMAGKERTAWRRQQHLSLSLVPKITVIRTEHRQLKQEGKEKKNMLEAREHGCFRQQIAAMPST